MDRDWEWERKHQKKSVKEDSSSFQHLRPTFEPTLEFIEGEIELDALPMPYRVHTSQSKLSKRR